MPAQTTFEQYGGFAQVSRIVSSFYDKMLDSPVTGPYFAGIDMKRQIDHQTKFIATLMGGPVSYTNEQLERVHGRLNITDAAFRETVMLLKETLEDFGISKPDIKYIEREFLSRKNFIVAKR
jgi:hemoglobin